MRHGLAEPFSGRVSDRERPLTQAGVRRTRGVAQVMASAGFEIETVVCSPFLRARQTADIIAETLDIPVEPLDALASGCSSADLVRVMVEQNATRRALIVGHQPEIGQAVSALTGCSLIVPESVLIVIDAAGGRGRLAGLYDPGHLERIAGGLRRADESTNMALPGTT